MHINFIDLNLECPKYPYPFPNIDRFIKGLLGYLTFSFIVPTLGITRLRWIPLNAPKNAFMFNCYNYYYEVIPFDLKMKAQFTRGWWCCLFKSNMVQSQSLYRQHGNKDINVRKLFNDLKYISNSFMKYNMHMKSSKCLFEVYVGNF